MSSPTTGPTACLTPGVSVKLHSLACATRSAVQGATPAASTGIHWANVAMGVGGIATVGALLVSLYLLRQQMRNQWQADRDRHRDHASRVSFWLTLRKVDDATDTVYGAPEPEVTADVHIVNASLMPAMSVTVLIGIRGDIWRDTSEKDNVTHDESVSEWSAVAIAPQESKSFPRSVKVPRSVAEMAAEYGNTALIGELLFTDSAGVSWVRTHSGDLIERSSAEWINSIPLSLSKRDEGRRNRQQRKQSRLRRWVR